MAQDFAQITQEARVLMTKRGARMSVVELDRVVSLIRSCEEAQRQCAELQKRLDQARNELAALTRGTGPPSEPAQALASLPPRGAPPNRTQHPATGKIAGEKARGELLATLQEHGVRLVRAGKRVFHTPSGRKLGIAYASEVPERPDKWWLGLPDEPFDIVVLLCRSLDGGLSEFVLPSHFVTQVWPQLSRNSSGQRIFHVYKSGPNYELADKVSSELRHITEYLRRYELIG